MKMSTSLQISIDSLPPLLQVIPAKTDVHDWSSESSCPSIWYNLVLVAASVVFVAYLAFHAKKNLKKLYNRGSYILISYYALLWFATAFNLFWSSLQVFLLYLGEILILILMIFWMVWDFDYDEVGNAMLFGERCSVESPEFIHNIRNALFGD